MVGEPLMRFISIPLKASTKGEAFLDLGSHKPEA